MALNKFMHSRNIYKDHPPSFVVLSEKFPNFKKYVHFNKSGKPYVNFRDPNVVRCLSLCLLEKDFNLKIELPTDRLAPTIPLRVNYILWMEDLLNCLPTSDTRTILDIGCGSSCVYPLLGCRMNKSWKFVASEVDEKNRDFAARNVQSNMLTDKIKLIHSTDEDPLLCAKGLDACMCNPPFYSSDDELLTEPDRPVANSSNSGGRPELIGGDSVFAKRIFRESCQNETAAKWYTIMFGKKSSFTEFEKYLQSEHVKTMACTEFCQGRTMRWGVAWAFTVIDISALPKRCKDSCKSKHKKVFSFSSKFATVEESVVGTIELLNTLEINFVQENLKFLLKGNLCSTLLNRKARRNEKFAREQSCSPPKSKNFKPNSLINSENVVCSLAIKPMEFGTPCFELTPILNDNSDLINRFYLYIRDRL